MLSPGNPAPVTYISGGSGCSAGPAASCSTPLPRGAGALLGANGVSHRMWLPGCSSAPHHPLKRGFLTLWARKKAALGLDRDEASQPATGASAVLGNQPVDRMAHSQD